MNKKIQVQIKRIEPMKTYTCQNCGNHFDAPVRCWYSLWCGPRCKMQGYRARRRQAAAIGQSMQPARMSV